MSGHTPWRVHIAPAAKTVETLTSADHYDSEYVAVVGADGTVIADNAGYYPQPLDPENAHLISAAPELLRAAIEAESDMAWAQSAIPGTNFQSSLILLRSAIAKATQT